MARDGIHLLVTRFPNRKIRGKYPIGNIRKIH